ncbi:MAG: BNR-4 repeat-containing protein [Pirellulales bacterium]|nr:BNR-4 repeat-containing protein [Pirellulales bacterium]
MKRSFLCILFCLTWTANPSRCFADAPREPSESELAIGGVGGVYFLAGPGELTVDLEKRDRNRANIRTELRAILAGPDRRILQETVIPDDGLTTRGQPGPIQRARLAAKVPRKGVYALNVTVSQDRYGDHILWGFRTNCPHYLVETSRGHRDRAHEEPIVLSNPEQPGNVCFLPRRTEFSMEITGLPKDAGPLQVFDGRGALMETLQPTADATASHAFPADRHRDAVPWRLHLPRQQANIQIDGVTRWNSSDLYPNLSLWTPDPASFFPLAEYRWLLTPYSRAAYGKPGEQGEIAFQVHNNAPVEKTIQLGLEFPETSWPVECSSSKVVVPARRAQDVLLKYTVPPAGQTRLCHLRATPESDPDFSTYSTLTVSAGTAPASRSFEIPLVLKPYAHENELFGYLPDYPVENQMYFDPENRPCVKMPGGIAMLRDRAWSTVDLTAAVTSRVPAFEGSSFGAPSAKIAFDRDGDMYTLASAGRKIALLHSRDGGKTFAACLIPGREGEPRSFDIEQFSGQNLLDGPPPVLRYTQTAKDPDLIWRSLQDLELFCPTKVDGQVVMSEPVLLTKKCIGLAAHSGIPSCVVSRGSKVNVVWGEATDPNEKPAGVPTYVATYDRTAHKAGQPALVAYGPPANDVHNTPSITMDRHGFLHVLAGTHGRPFPYVQSLEPNNAHAGWTDPVTLGEGANQTYIGLVCGPDDTLYAAFRLWKQGEPPFPASHHATLAFQRKPANKPWEEPRVLMVPPFSEYSVFYHRLTLDRRGRLFLSYDYWSTFWFYRTDHRGNRRALIMSPDGGTTWKLVETADFLQAES